MSDEQIEKPIPEEKQHKRRYEFTEARKAAWERCLKAREESRKNIDIRKEKEKVIKREEKLMKKKEELGMVDKEPTIPELKEEEPVVEKPKKKPPSKKKVVIVASSSSESESSDEEIVIVKRDKKKVTRPKPEKYGVEETDGHRPESPQRFYMPQYNFL